jgi:hypothetical protein
MPPLLRKGVLLPSKGVNFAIPAEFIDDQQAFAKNMRYDKGVMRKRPGKTTVGAQTPDADQIMGYGLLQLSSGSKHLVRASKKRIQRLNTATTTWETISIITFTSGDEDFMAFANVTESNILISSNYLSPMYKWIGSGNQTLLGGTPPKAKYLAYVTPYLLAAYTDDGVNVEPWRVAWCDTDNPAVWSGGNSGEALITDEPSPIQNIAKLNEFCAVYKKDSLAIGIKVDPPDIFRFETIKTGVGLLAPRAFAEAEGQHYFMGKNDFYVWNGVRVESIGAAVREHVFSRINTSKINRCFALHVQEQTEVWFVILTSSDTWATEIWKYNYRFGFWYFDTCSGLTAGLRWENVSSPSWNDLTGTWDQQQTSWDGLATGQGTEQIMFGTSAGLSAKLDYTLTDDQGSAVSAQFESKDFSAESYELGARWLKLDIWAKGPGKMYVDYSTDGGSNWISIPWQTTQSYVDLTGVMNKYEWYFDIWAKNIRFRMRNAESNEPFYIQQFFPYYLNREQAATYRS